jgi:hypothetical protein
MSMRFAVMPGPSTASGLFTMSGLSTMPEPSICLGFLAIPEPFIMTRLSAAMPVLGVLF